MQIHYISNVKLNNNLLDEPLSENTQRILLLEWYTKIFRALKWFIADGKKKDH